MAQPAAVRLTPDYDNTWYLYKRLYKYIKPYLFRAIVSVLITIPIGSLDAAIAYSLRPYLDGVLVKQSLHSVSYVPFIIVGFTVVQGALNYISIYLSGWLGMHIVNDLRSTLFQKLQTFDVRYFDTNTSGGIIQRFYTDPEILQNNVLSSVKDVLTKFFSSLSLIYVLLATSWQLAIVAVISILFILFPLTRIRNVLRNLSIQMTTVATDMLSFYNETANGIRIIYSYNLGPIRLERFHAFQRMIYSQGMRVVKTQGWLTPSMHITASVGIAIIIYSGSHMVAKGHLTTGAFVSFLAALIMLYNPIKNLGSTVMSAQQSMLAAGRIFNLIDLIPDVRDLSTTVPLEGFHDSIEFDNVEFYYSPDTPVLKNLNLTIRKGETLALVGNSGGGKSTIVNLIPRFYDVVSGMIRLDGQDIRAYSLFSMRALISLVTQENFLFNGTIRHNLLLSKVDATEEDLWDAIEKAYLKEFIEGLPEGLDTKIGERGVMLSGGQRQRVAIARALLRNTPIVILDEATSALDSRSEAMVQKAIESLIADRTVIIIAHRLSTIRNADRIIVISEGKIVEEGTHDDLVLMEGVYSMLYNTQYKTAQITTAAPETV